MDIIKKYWLPILGIIIGGIGGYAYYHFIGCNSGTCAITSKPLNSTAYGMIMGYLLFSIAKPNIKSPVNNKQDN